MIAVAKSPRRHILTVNLEDYFQAAPLNSAIPHRYWPRFESRVERNTLAVLDLLDEFGHKATFFTVGWIADRLPEIIREVARRGHEVASKGYYHRSIRQMSPQEFRADVVRSRVSLEKASGQAVRGYRIARCWFAEKDLWALDVLAAEGFEYDSSLRPLGLSPISHPERMFLFRHHIGGRAIWEVPVASWRVGPFHLPVSGGNFVRQLPEAFIRGRIANWVEKSEAPLVFYFDIWELDPDQPRITAVPTLNRLRQYRNLEQMSDRIRYYLGSYRFCAASDYLQLPPKSPKANALAELAAPARMFAASGRRPVTVVVPCYNEEPALKYLKNTLDQFILEHGNDFDLSFVFVDDGSHDRTSEYLNELFGTNPNCNIVRHEKNRGVAAATLTGIRCAETETVCVIDCDCSYDPKHLAKMVPMLTEGVDLVTASPYHREGVTKNVPHWRLLLSRGLSRLYRLTLRSKLATYTACFRVYRRSAVHDLQIEHEGYFGISEILIRMDLAGANIVECPAALESRLLGESKMALISTSLGHLRLLVRLLSHRMQLKRS